MLAEVEQILLVGSQQLQLAGNVKAALIALESADSRLQRADSAQFTGLRRAIRARHRAPARRALTWTSSA